MFRDLAGSVRRIIEDSQARHDDPGRLTELSGQPAVRDRDRLLRLASLLEVRGYSCPASSLSACLMTFPSGWMACPHGGQGQRGNWPGPARIRQPSRRPPTCGTSTGTWHGLGAAMRAHLDDGPAAAGGLRPAVSSWTPLMRATRALLDPPRLTPPAPGAR